MKQNESNLSTDRGNHETPPTKQHHRLALGEKVTGMSNPNGAERGPTDNRIGNNQGKTY
jgi:hypothetical protein